MCTRKVWLPKDIWEHVTDEWLDLVTVCKIESVCKGWKEIVDDYGRRTATAYRKLIPEHFSRVSLEGLAPEIPMYQVYAQLMYLRLPLQKQIVNPPYDQLDDIVKRIKEADRLKCSYAFDAIIEYLIKKNDIPFSLCGQIQR